jgi:DNA mismatch endonuclease (patch repair protein)
MTDKFTKRERSEIMRSVKSRENQSTELKLISIFKDYKIKGWRRNYKLHGKPDFVFPQKKIALFADGCFWHGHNCRGLKPSTNQQYWDNKISKNRRRDNETNRYLSNIGWTVIRIWECELKKRKLPKRFVNLFNKTSA